MKSLIVIFALVVLFTCHVFHSAFAGNWFYQTTIATQLEGDDNKRLRSSDEEGVVGVEVSASINLSKKTEVSELYARGELRSDRYDGDEDSGLDTDDQLLYAGGSWRGERSELVVDGEFRRESSLLTELEDTGFFEQVERRVTKSITPQYTFNLSETMNFSGGIFYTDVEFPNAVPVSLTEYDYTSANVSLIKSLSETSSLSLNAFHSKYDADTFSSEVDSTGTSLRYSAIPSEKWQYYVGVGYRKSNFKNQVGGITVRDDDTGAIYEAGVIRESETLNLELTLRNELEPSASGNVNERTEYEFIATKLISERFTARLNLFWLENESVNDDSDNNDREYWSAQLSGDYRIAEHWYLTGQLRHRDQEFDNSVGSSSAESDAIIFGIRYSGQDKRI